MANKKKLYWSASRMNLWKRCRKCYWLKYEMNVPQVADNDLFFAYGKYIHESIEARENGQPTKDIAEMLGATSDPSLFHIAHKHLEQYETVKKKLGLTHGVSEVEFYVETDIDDPVHGGKLALFGFLDYVEYSKDTIIMPKVLRLSKGKIKAFSEDGKEVKDFKIAKVVEYKTRKGRYSIKEIDTEYQFSLYFAVAKFFPKSTAFRMVLVNFVKDANGTVQVAQIKRNVQDMKNLWAETDRALQDMKNHIIPPLSTCGFFSPYGEVCESFDPLTITK